jgi:hypothetical protein
VQYKKCKVPTNKDQRLDHKDQRFTRCRRTKTRVLLMDSNAFSPNPMAGHTRFAVEVALQTLDPGIFILVAFVTIHFANQAHA